jgi:hypothetical protein
VAVLPQNRNLIEVCSFLIGWFCVWACEVAGFKFDRRLKMEQKLHRLYKCFDGADAGQVSARRRGYGLGTGEPMGRHGSNKKRKGF